MFLSHPKTATYSQQLLSIPDGRQGTLATLKIMSKLAKEGKTNPAIRQLALRLISHIPAKDWFAEIRALHEFVRDKIRYVRDVFGVETLHTPEKLLEIGQGDCDDKSILLAALLMSIGHPTRFVAVSFGAKNQFSHVYVETRIGHKWIALETTMPWNAGIYPPGITDRLIVHN